MKMRSAPLLLALGCTAGCSAAPAPRSIVEIFAPAPATIEAREPVIAIEPGSIPVTSHDPTIGHADALVTLVVFADLSDPLYPKEAKLLLDFEAKLGPDRLRVAWKSLPMGYDDESARSSAQAAAAVMKAGGSQAFWAFHGIVIQRTSAELPLEDWAVRAGVGRAAFRAALASAEAGRALDEDIQLGRDLRLPRGKITFFVNGAECSYRTSCNTYDQSDLERMGHAEDPEFLDWLASSSHLDAMIAEELDAARAALRAGTPRHKLYAERCRNQRAAAIPVEMSAKHILIQYKGAKSAQPSNTRTRAAARVLAEDVAEKAREQWASWPALVTQFSDEPGAADRAGDLGEFGPGDMVPEFEKAVAALKVGEISGVVETEYGFHVIRRTY
jgi:protein-disulfide isomerase